MTEMLTEEDTKQRLITPALQHAGWSATQMMMEYDLRSDRFRIVPDQNRAVKESTRAKADYLLCYGINRPIAVLEAKRQGRQDSEGLDQAIVYAKKLGIPFAYSSSGNKFIEYNIHTGRQRELTLESFPSPGELWSKWCNIRDVHPRDKKQLEATTKYTNMDGKTPPITQRWMVGPLVITKWLLLTRLSMPLSQTIESAPSLLWQRVPEKHSRLFKLFGVCGKLGSLAMFSILLIATNS